MKKYLFSVDLKMAKLIKEELVQVVAYEDDGGIPMRPFVEIQTDLEKTDVDHTEFVSKFESSEEANVCVREVADYLGIPFKTI